MMLGPVGSTLWRISLLHNFLPEWILEPSANLTIRSSITFYNAGDNFMDSFEYLSFIDNNDAITSIIF